MRFRLHWHGLLLTAFLQVVAGSAASAQEEAPHAVGEAPPGRMDTLAEIPQYSLNDQAPAWHDMVTNIPGDWVRSARLTFQPRNLPAAAGVAGLTAAFMAADQRLYRGNRKLWERSAFVRSSSDVFVRIGDGTTHLGIGAALALYGAYADDHRAVRAGSQTVESFLASGIVVQILKHMTGRETPQVSSQDGGSWKFFPNLGDYQRHQSRYFSYPSGHIASTMSTVTVLVENYPEAEWLRPVGYGAVGLVGLSLVNVGYHWYSDLPLGIVVGYVVGKAASHSGAVSPDEQPGVGGATVSWSPVLDTRRAGVMMTLCF